MSHPNLYDPDLAEESGGWLSAEEMVRHTTKSTKSIPNSTKYSATVAGLEPSRKLHTNESKFSQIIGECWLTATHVKN